MPTRITVVTPSFNQARYLEETLRSVLCQRDQIHEYFVYDGGSSDGSADLIRKYAGRGIDYWESQRDKGQSDAIAKGFARATGDVLCWLNSDDVFLPGALKKVRAAFDAHPAWDVLTGYHARIGADTCIRSLKRIPRESAGWAAWGVLHVCQQTCFFKRNLYEKVGGLRKDLHTLMDTDLWVRMMEAGSVWGHIPDFLAGFRIHDEAKGSLMHTEWREETERLAEAHPRLFPGRFRRQFGTAWYRILQLASGRFLRARAESKRLVHKKLTEVFGDWDVSDEVLQRT